MFRLRILYLSLCWTMRFWVTALRVAVRLATSKE